MTNDTLRAFQRLPAAAPLLRPRIDTLQLIWFLYSDKGTSYSPVELADSLGISEEQADTTLSALHESVHDGLTNDGRHHALQYRKDLRRYAASLDQVERWFSDPDYKVATNFENGPPEPVDEEKLEAKLDELLAELEEEGSDKPGFPGEFENESVYWRNSRT